MGARSADQGLPRGAPTAVLRPLGAPEESGTAQRPATKPPKDERGAWHGNDLPPRAFDRSVGQPVAVMADRERLAEKVRALRDIHDDVVRQLFGCAMALQSVVDRDPRPELVGTLDHVIDELDDAITELRSTRLLCDKRRSRAGGGRAGI